MLAVRNRRPAPARHDPEDAAGTSCRGTAASTAAADLGIRHVASRLPQCRIRRDDPLRKQSLLGSLATGGRTAAGKDHGAFFNRLRPPFIARRRASSGSRSSAGADHGSRACAAKRPRGANEAFARAIRRAWRNGPALPGRVAVEAAPWKAPGGPGVGVATRLPQSGRARGPRPGHHLPCLWILFIGKNTCAYQ